ncbi:MAG: Hsp20/alpha crystallin family protein [Tepidisphaerales bacterium]
MPLQLASLPGFGFPRGGKPRPGSGFCGFYTEQRWTPAVNLYETEAGYSVCVDLAGVDKNRIDVEVLDRQLRLSGHRPVPSDFGPGSDDAPAANPPAHAAGKVGGGGVVGNPGRRCRVHVMEIDHGAFERLVELPADADADQITARYREGFLWIDIPRRVGR